MDTYVLKAGLEHNGFDKDGERKVFVGGDSVELTESQAEAFKDKFESDADIKARLVAEAESARLQDEVDALRAELDAIKAKAPDAPKTTAPNTTQAPVVK